MALIIASFPDGTRVERYTERIYPYAVYVECKDGSCRWLRWAANEADADLLIHQLEHLVGKGTRAHWTRLGVVDTLITRYPKPTRAAPLDLPACACSTGASVQGKPPIE